METSIIHYSIYRTAVSVDLNLLSKFLGKLDLLSKDLCRIESTVQALG